MGWDPPPDIKKFRSKDGIEDFIYTNVMQIVSSPNSNYSSSNHQKSEMSTVHISEKELMNVQRIIDLQKNGLLRVKLNTGIAISTHKATVPSESRSQNQRGSGVIRANIHTGVYPPGHGATDGIVFTRRTNSGEEKGGGAGGPASIMDQSQCQIISHDMEQLQNTKRDLESSPKHLNIACNTVNSGDAGAPANYRVRDQCQKDHNGGVHLPSHLRYFKSSQTSSHSKIRQEDCGGAGAPGLVHDPLNDNNIDHNVKKQNHHISGAHAAAGIFTPSNLITKDYNMLKSSGDHANEYPGTAGNTSMQNDIVPSTSSMLKSIGTQLQSNENEHHGVVIDCSIQGKEGYIQNDASNMFKYSNDVPTATQGREDYIQKDAGNKFKSSNVVPTTIQNQGTNTPNLIAAHKKNTPNQHNFPKISSNFDKPNQNHQETKLVPNKSQPNEHNLITNSASLRVSNNFEVFNPNNHKRDQNSHPPSRKNLVAKNNNQIRAPNPNTPNPPNPIVTHTLATRLRAQEAVQNTLIGISAPAITTK
ncbi:uncharacterized protein LOC129903710 [Solanum dulcamara]|uniref:uncharacterized protein LOC129903710 n=1 Tax=Solanum dulcamara TaxID=45834 RepID=UPI0024862C20|nr:uncharacterized protein LOC129903710 [Solanum dulcamara]